MDKIKTEDQEAFEGYLEYQLDSTIRQLVELYGVYKVCVLIEDSINNVNTNRRVQ